jgi:hypothetical protein
MPCSMTVAGPEEPGASPEDAWASAFDVLEVSFLRLKSRGGRSGTPTMLNEFERFS